MPWLAWHIHQHDNHDELLVGAVAPLLDELRGRGHVEQAFVLRYWEGGPHVRLRLRPSSAEATVRLATEVPERLERWCREHPSRRPMTSEDYRLLLLRLRGSDHGRPLVPDGTVLQEQYRPEVERYGTGGALHACETHFDESTSIAFAVLAGGPSAAARESLAVLVLLDVIRAMPAPHRRLWQDQVLRRRGTRVRRIDTTLLDQALARPPASVLQLRASLTALRTVLRAESAAYTAPGIGFGGIRLLEPGDSAPTATLDIAAHLFCNRIGITVPTELDLRLGIAAVLAGTTEPAG